MMIEYGCKLYIYKSSGSYIRIRTGSVVVGNCRHRGRLRIIVLHYFGEGSEKRQLAHRLSNVQMILVTFTDQTGIRSKHYIRAKISNCVCKSVQQILCFIPISIRKTEKYNSVTPKAAAEAIASFFLISINASHVVPLGAFSRP